MDTDGSWEYCVIGDREVSGCATLTADRQWTATVIGPKWRFQIAASPPYAGQGDAELNAMVSKLANAGWELIPGNPTGVHCLLRRV